MTKVLITGGSGFLGRNLAESLMDKYEVILTSRNQKALMHAASFLGLEFAPLDVTNQGAVQECFERYKPQIVIHAAATKFVDLAEKFPSDCVDNNIIGSQNVARAAITSSVKHVIGISTDKAAPPVANIYGLTKAVMEKLFLSLNGNFETSFSIVRYGNVAWSTGSVFPIWKKSIIRDGQVVSTGPHMTRFFFSIEEAVDLIITAIDNVEMTAGKILSIPMKGVVIKRILDVWSNYAGFSWSPTTGRVGDRTLEYLIGPTEIRNTSFTKIGNKEFFLMEGQGRLANKPIMKEYSSENAEQMSDSDILNLILKEPEEI